MQSEWLINRREKKCHDCSRDFTEGDNYIGALVKENNEFLRYDYCVSCWDVDEGLKKDDIFSFWRGHIPIKEEIEEEPLSNIEKVEKLLKKLTEQKKVPMEACYLLAVILERKRIIKQVDTKIDSSTGEEKLVFEFKKTGESIVLTNPHIKLEEIPLIQAEIEEILGNTDRHGLEHGRTQT
ncbi:hypothetical protein ACFL1F_01140 [Chlamydiota bacterium]